MGELGVEREEGKSYNWNEMGGWSISDMKAYAGRPTKNPRSFSGNEQTAHSRRMSGGEKFDGRPRQVDGICNYEIILKKIKKKSFRPADLNFTLAHSPGMSKSLIPGE